MIADRLEKLVEEMVDKGVQFEDAVREAIGIRSKTDQLAAA